MKPGEPLLVNEVPHHRVPEVPLPVNLLGPGDVAGVVEEDVLVHLQDAERRVLEVLFYPGRAHQNFRMGVSHRATSSPHYTPECVGNKEEGHIGQT
jgi:hypothetical protein